MTTRICRWVSSTATASLTRAPDSILSAGRVLALPDEVEGDVDDHVLLATDHRPPPDLDEDRAGVQPVLLGGPLGVPEEARVDPGVAQRQRLAVDQDRAVLQRPHEVV